MGASEARFGEWVIAARWPIIAATLILVAIAASGARFLEFSSDYRVYFNEDNPQLLAFEALENTYTEAGNVFFAIVPGDRDATSALALDAAAWLTERAWQNPVLDPCRFPHQLPAHHGRRRRSRGARSRGRGGPRGCRRAVPDPRRRPRRAPACSTPHRPRRRGQRRQRDGAAAGRGRDAGRPHGRRIRARSRGRGSGSASPASASGSRGW